MKTTLAAVLAVALSVGILGLGSYAAQAIVNPVTPLNCEGTDVPAFEASGGKAGGIPAIPHLLEADPPPGPPFPAEGGHSVQCAGD